MLGHQVTSLVQFMCLAAYQMFVGYFMPKFD